MRKLVIARRFSQAFFLLVFIYVLWSTTFPLKGLLPPETFFRTNPLIMILTSVSERLILPGIVFSLAMLLLTLIFGRFYCGWVCPLGAMIDLTGSVRKKKNLPAYDASRKIRPVKFFLFGIFAVLSVLGIQLAWVLDPMVIMARFVSFNLIPTVTLFMDKAFIFLIQKVGLYGPLHDLYRALKHTVLGVKVHYFANSGIIFLAFLVVCAAALFIARFWCRAVCPLGAFYALTARFALFRRSADKCIGCGNCVSSCRTGAISDGTSYDKGECVLCMDCVYECPANTIKFGCPSVKVGEGDAQKGGISRKDFIFLLLSSLFLSGFKWKDVFKKGKTIGSVIRPPAALRECEFLNRCVRCGNCMKVCPTNGLQPTMLESGIEGIWTPHLVPEIGYCEYRCTLCGNVCPTGAIEKISLEKKLKVKLGTAKVNRSTCIAWANKSECLVCEEHCPVPAKAIKIVQEKAGTRVIGKPVVSKELCVGCGICQTKCPVRPKRAITVSPEGSDRS